MKKETKIITGIIISLTVLIVLRLGYLQLTVNSYKTLAEINSLLKEKILPKRGKIYDRNGKLLVSNQAVYSVYVIPSQTKVFDTTLLLNLLKIDKKTLLKQLQKAKHYSYFKPSPVAEHYLMNEIAPLQEQIYQFPGFFIKKKFIRKYHTKHAANVLGYLQEVSPVVLKRDSFYDPGDFIGVAGIEKYYEKFLRGKKGVRYYNRDKFNRKTSPYKNGQMDIKPVAGKDIKLSIDIGLQAFIDSLLLGKHGAVVVLNSKNGEILALVSAPSYDPASLEGRQRNTVIKSLLQDKVNKPLYDRSILGMYPPGSPFKLINALIGLQEKVINQSTFFICNGGFKYGNRFMRCHCGAHGKVRLNYAIPYSCNTYFSNTYLRILGHENTRTGLQKWSEYVKSFGLGNYLGIDLPTGRKGLIPDTTYYDRYFGNKKWRGTYIISNAIGQGQVLVTPIQMANLTAAIANKGFYYTPHLIKNIQGDDIPHKFRTKHQTLIDSVYFTPVIKGMHEVYTKGTARYSQVKGIDICGKTGTSENFIIRNGKKIQLPDHSIFVAFAPRNNPEIVVSIFIENGGFGSNLAAPMASLIIEKYLRGQISRTDLLEKVIHTHLEEIYQLKSDEPGKKTQH